MNRLNLQRIEIFRAVFETTSMSRAARRLRLAQPTVSRHLAVLEDELGFALFLRRQGRIEPTWEAQRLYHETAGLFERLAMIEQTVTSIRSGSDEALRVMAATSYSLRVLPHAIALWRKAAPQTELTVDTGSAAKQIRALRTGEIDLAVSSSVKAQAGLRITPFGRQPLVAVMPQDHALAGKGRVALADFADHPCVLLSPDAPVGALIQKGFHQAGVTPDRIMTAVDPTFAVGLVAALHCLTIVDSILFDSLATAGLIRRPLESAPEIELVTLEVESTPSRRVIAEFQKALGIATRRFMPDPVTD